MQIGCSKLNYDNILKYIKYMFNFNRMFLKYSIQGFYFISKLWGQKIINIFYKKISLVEITLEN
jgi:hypothetical protein